MVGDGGGLGASQSRQESGKSLTISPFPAAKPQNGRLLMRIQKERNQVVAGPGRWVGMGLFCSLSCRMVSHMKREATGILGEGCQAGEIIQSAFKWEEKCRRVLHSYFQWPYIKQHRN